MENQKSLLFRKIYDNKTLFYFLLALFTLIVIFGISLYNRGRISVDEWSSINAGMNKSTVIEYVGEPLTKTIEPQLIRDSFSALLFAPSFAGSDGDVIEAGYEEMGIDKDALEELVYYQDNGSYQIEMFTYKVDGAERHLYFIDDEVFTKK